MGPGARSPRTNFPGPAADAGAGPPRHTVPGTAVAYRSTKYRASQDFQVDLQVENLVLSSTTVDGPLRVRWHAISPFWSC
eukprot:766656-Hanusia_phi.AAC.1